MDKILKFQKIAEETNSKLDEFINYLDGEKISDIRQFIKASKFELDPTKRKLAEILEAKLSEKINKQTLT